MRLSLIPLVAALSAMSTTVSADLLTIYTTCYNTGASCDSFGRWHTAFGHHDINANEGCRNPSGTVPNMYEFCMDWGNHRAHFYFTGQSKRCMAVLGNLEFTPLRWMDAWKEVPCTW